MHTTDQNPKLLTRLLFTLFASLLLASCAKVEPVAEVKAPPPQVVVEKPIVVATPKKVAPQKMPARFKNTAEKKRLFFAFMKPFVIEENNRVLKLRSRLIEMQSDLLSPDDLSWLAGIAKQYKVTMKGLPDEQFWQQMLARVDIVPVEMALVQAANESAWGQSRFAKEGKNYFGQWCYSKGCGIVPSQRNKGSTHEVRSFESAGLSVRAYIQNINRSRAYREFRRIRVDLRNKNQPLDAEKLAMGLKSYSERGMAYVKTIQSMIRSNRKLIAAS